MSYNQPVKKMLGKKIWNTFVMLSLNGFSYDCIVRGRKKAFSGIGFCMKHV